MKFGETCEVIIGMVFPILPKHVERIFAGSNVFCRFLNIKSLKGIKIKEGDAFFIYQTQSKKEIVGEAKIKKIEMLTFYKLIKKYEEKNLFAPINDLKIYSKGRKNKEMLIIKLKDIKKYKKPKKFLSKMTLSGGYIRK